MVCYKCGCRLSEHDYCTGCGEDVTLYKKIMCMSNHFYNDGLDKATVRDLSGALVSLRQSLKFNKNNIEARNLLGLVYFEMGEVVSALKEWVISQNLRPKKNVANNYIDTFWSNQTRLDAINQTIKKYNQALGYCYQDSQDLAIIQLKKVLSYNPKYIRARQLLALLYINADEWEKARKELLRCCHIDTNNTTTLRYLREVEQMLAPEDGSKNTSKKKTGSGEVIRYQSGNEMIIQPVNGKERKGASVLLNLGIGIVIGIAIARFLILPAIIQGANAEISDNLRVVSEQSDAKTATIDEQQQKIQSLSDENLRLQDELATYEGTDGALKATDGLMLAVGAYLQNPDDVETIAGYMEALEQEEGAEEENRTPSFTDLESKFLAVVSERLGAYYYDIGFRSYNAEEFDKAIPALERAYRYNNTNVDALFYLGNSCRQSGDTDRAKEVYAQVIDNFPGPNRASRSETYLAEINNENQPAE